MKITPEIIEKINQVYLEVGTYANTAKVIGCSTSTVKKYLSTSPTRPNKPINHMFFSDSVIEKDKLIVPRTNKGISQWSFLSGAELADIKVLWEDM